MLQAFFTDRLMRQRQASSHTIASYRDTFRLLLKFAQNHLKKEASAVAITDLILHLSELSSITSKKTGVLVRAAGMSDSQRFTPFSGTLRSRNQPTVHSLSEYWQCRANAGIVGPFSS